MATHGKWKNKARELISCKPRALKHYIVIGQGKNIPVCEKIEMPGSWSCKVLNYLIMHISFSRSPCTMIHCLCPFVSKAPTAQLYEIKYFSLHILHP